jgi:hypothetical protein
VHKFAHLTRTGLLAALGFVAVAAFPASPVSAQETTGATAAAAPAPAAKATRAVARKQAPRAGGQYFIEFRSRYALSYGHTFAAFGRLNAKGEIVEREVAGLHPAGDSPVPWMMGHFFIVPSETGPSDGDLEDEYISARYRVVLNEAEYRKVVAQIRKMQASSPVWHAVLYNCNAFVADIARFMGLKTPSSTLLYPADFINEMRTLNNNQRTVAIVGETVPN